MIALAPSGGGSAARRDGRAPADPALRCGRSTRSRSPSPPPRSRPRPPQAAVKVAAAGYADPSVDGAVLALHRPGGIGELRGPAGIAAAARQPPGGRRRPASAWIDGATRRRPGRRARSPRPARTRVAVVGELGRLARRPGAVRRAARPAQGFAPRRVRHRRRRQAARSAGNLLVFELDGRIEAYRPRDRRSGPLLRRESRAELRGPSVLGNRLTYVRATYKRQQVMTGPFVPRKVSQRPHALRHDAHRPPRRRPRAGPLPRQGPHQQAAVGAPAGGRPRHADHDRHRGRPPSTSPASASCAGRTPTAEILRIDL